MVQVSGAGVDRTGSIRQALVLLVIVLSGLAGVQLFVLGDSTASYFAWTVKPPLAAAFLGAAYWGVAAAAIAAYRSERWSELSLLLPVATVATTLVLVATVLHLDRFHLGSAEFVPLTAAWVWLAVYVIVPPVFALLWLVELRQRGMGSLAAARTMAGVATTRPLPQWLRASFAVMGAGLAIVAAILFLAPGTLAWPWTLTPLTSRMTGAFLAGFASAVLVMAVENDLRRVRIATTAVVGFGIFEVLAIGRFASDVSLSAVVTWLWLLFLAATIGLGAAVLVLGSDRTGH